MARIQQEKLNVILLQNNAEISEFTIFIVEKY